MFVHEVIFASSNDNKLREVMVAAAGSGIVVRSASEEARTRPEIGPPPAVEETSATYIGNALLKADAYFQWCGKPVLADDSGIEARALGGIPGVYSARYAGDGSSAEENNAKLLDALQPCADKGALMRTVLCVKLADGVYLHTDGVLEGEIVAPPRGRTGWGYEPIFLLPSYNKTVAELRDDQIAIVSHRGAALSRMFALLAGRGGERSI